MLPKPRDTPLRTRPQCAYYKGDTWQAASVLWLIRDNAGGLTLMRPQDH